MEEKKVKTPQELDPEQMTDVNGGKLVGCIGGTNSGGLHDNMRFIYRCPICQMLLNGQAALMEHMQVYHPTVNPES